VWQQKIDNDVVVRGRNLWKVLKRTGELSRCILKGRTKRTSSGSLPGGFAKLALNYCDAFFCGVHVGWKRNDGDAINNPIWGAKRDQEFFSGAKLFAAFQEFPLKLIPLDLKKCKEISLIRKPCSVGLSPVLFSLDKHEGFWMLAWLTLIYRFAKA
jgi:hypothetical protein